MFEKTIQPTTLVGIKRYAKEIKKARGIIHAAALDEAAKAGGFPSFRDARRLLQQKAPSHVVFITAYWRDRESKARGRETLRLELGRPLQELITPTQARRDRYLGNVRFEASDHLVDQSPDETQELARRSACRIARTLQFIAATGLIPSDARRYWPKGDWDNRLPGADHSSVWYHAPTRRHVIADEPYVEHDRPIARDRLDWAARHGWEITKPTWAGIYAPDGGCHLFLMADAAKGPLIAKLTDSLDRSELPVSHKKWTGESASYEANFTTPGGLADRQARANAAVKPRKTRRKRASVAYHMTFAGRRLRPGARLSIECHTELGSLLKSVLVNAADRPGAANRVNAIRSELDEWVMREYSRDELDGETFFDLYYHEVSAREAPKLTIPEMIAKLETVKAMLVKGYPPCPPLDAIVSKANLAIASLSSWNSSVRRRF
jgi:hypothetical protein